MERKKITVEELLERYEKGERDFSKIILEYADLSGVELRNLSFGGAILSYVNLSNIKLECCNLRAEFMYCNFTNAVMENCDLGWARFFDCDLRKAISRLCTLSSTKFTRVNLENSKLDGSGEDPSEYWDVTREDGVFVPGFTFDLYMAESIERIAELRRNGEDVF
ncbi:MAG: pentapeptide repeat-containing protein [Cyanobacteria bacterium P01_C01_bin.38]